VSYDLRFRGERRPREPVRAALAKRLGSSLHRKDGDDWLGVDLWYADPGDSAVEPPPEHAGLFDRADIHLSKTMYGVTWKQRQLAVEIADRITALATRASDRRARARRRGLIVHWPSRPVGPGSHRARRRRRSGS
jgi:hypothetical protein